MFIKNEKMKKTLTILGLLGMLFSNAVSAQTFVSQHTAEGDSSIESGSGVIKVKNYLKSASATAVVLDWHVIDTSLNLSRSGAIWALDGICDNKLCYSGTPLFAGAVNQSMPYADADFGTFYALLNSDNAPVGSSAWVKVSATDTATGGTTRTLTFIANKTPTAYSQFGNQFMLFYLYYL